MPTVLRTSAIATAVEFDEAMMHVALVDRRIISVPLVWFSTPRNATLSELQNYEISPAGIGILWQDLGEDLPVASLMVSR